MEQFCVRYCIFTGVWWLVWLLTLLTLTANTPFPPITTIYLITYFTRLKYIEFLTSETLPQAQCWTISANHNISSIISSGSIPGCQCQCEWDQGLRWDLCYLIQGRHRQLCYYATSRVSLRTHIWENWENYVCSPLWPLDTHQTLQNTQWICVWLN